MTGRSVRAGRLEDPRLVRDEYASEDRLQARASAYRFAEGPDPRTLLVEAIAEISPRRVLDVGCGPGEIAESIDTALGVDIVGVDQSERMIELTTLRGIEARVGDVQQLEFPNESFDCALAAWMLYHVPDVDRALGELARVLRPGGRLVAVTNGRDHWRELHELLGTPRIQTTFSAENGEELLARHFARVECRDASGWVEFPDRETAQRFVESTILLAEGPHELPPFEGPLRVRRAPVVFVADKA